MRVKKILPPRVFQVGLKKNKIFIKDTLHLYLKKGENIIFPTTKQTKPIELKMEKWGFILNADICKNNKDIDFKFFGANKKKIHFIAFFKKFKTKFKKYCQEEKLTVINVKKFINEI